MAANNYSLHILPDDVRLSVEGNPTISEAVQEAGIYLTQPCGGRGTCGRCIVFADGAPVKACVTKVDRDMTVHIPDTVRLTGQMVLTDIRAYDPGQNALPRVERVEVAMEPPSLEDAVSDASRLKDALAAQLQLPSDKVWFEAGALAKLPGRIRAANFTLPVTLVHENGGVTVLRAGGGRLYGIAVDIGTTTVVTALCDLETGFVLDTVGVSNPQAEHGSDVISRIVYTEESEDGGKELQALILDTLAESVKTLAVRANISAKSIPLMTIAANTVMSHFLLGLPCDDLRREPYVPAASVFPALRPSELGLPILPWGRVLVLPAVASYVGGDITAGVIATGLDKMPGLNMLVDVGTNGEMVLAGEGFMMACACSAGPAFEGSGISCGSRAVKGAIDNVFYTHGHMVYDIIGGHSVEPVSLCGSGLISLLSALLQKGAIDRAGRFTDGTDSFTLAPNVTITQADIQNLIRAKAAIFAGMRVLANSMDLHLSDIDHVYIAGGFGRHLNIGHATNIGMFPPLGKDAYSYMGNTSLAGALRVLCDRSVDEEGTAAAITNHELSIGNDFMEEFTKASFLPHTELDFYKEV